MSHLNTRMPTGNDVTQRRDLKPAFSNDLFEQVLQRDNLHRAWKRVRANKVATGVDGMITDAFLDWAKSSEWKWVQWHPKTLMKFKQQIRRLTNRNWGGIDAIPTVQNQPVYTRLDELFWYCQRLSALC